jgi:DNA-directed RNA polymerase
MEALTESTTEAIPNVLVRLLGDLSKRQAMLRADRHKMTMYLKDIPPDLLLNVAYPHLLKGMERNATLASIAVTVGRRIRQKSRLKQDTVLDAHAGWFVLVSFIECGIIKFILKPTYKSGKKAKHPSYHLMPVDWKAIEELWALVDKSKLDASPLRSPAADWTGHTHETGNTLVKKMSTEVSALCRDDPDWSVYRALNKLQRQGWVVNREVFAVYQQCLREPDDAGGPFKYSSEVDPKKQASLRMEVAAIERIALANQNNVFYHLFNYDWRGRIYVNTAYLHEQSSDNAKGLLKFDESVPLGAHGLWWFAVHTSNCFGNDKVSIDDRVNFTMDNQAEFIKFAEDPMTERGWMRADKPFMFLACCFELRAMNEWVSRGLDHRDFRSQLPLYIDGSNNGVQHLAALSLDETVAPLVNLTPSKLPGDVYRYVAEFVWAELEQMKAMLTTDEIAQFEPMFEKAKELQKNYASAPMNSEAKVAAYQAASEWRNANRALLVKLFPVYWCNITAPKDRRKIVKRNVMTLGYGGTPFGMGQQIIDDTRDMSPYLRDKEHLWGAMLGNLVYKTCYEKLPGPAMMLRLFQDMARRSNEAGRDLCWTVPVTGFPVVQKYREPITKRTKLLYGGQELKLQLEAWEDSKLDEGGQLTGTAPNIVHSFDAAHLNMVVVNAPYAVSVVHDSFGCHAGNMADLFRLVREQFMLLYAHDPLMCVLAENNYQDLMPERGNLDLSQILESDFAFV